MHARGGSSAAEFTYKDAPQFGEARAISKFAQELFVKGEVDAVDILFTKFISTLDQRPESLPFLPVGKIEAVITGVRRAQPQESPARGADGYFFEFEPDEATVLGELLPHSLNFQMSIRFCWRPRRANTAPAWWP